jgi:glycosyltransferase involved in cell wall biosynthesis
MRIAVVGPAHPIKGGISHYTTLLVRALRKKHDVLYVSYKYQYPACVYPGTGQFSYDQSPIFEENEPIWHSLKPWTLVRIANRAKKFGAELVIDTWVTQFLGFHTTSLAWLVKRIAKCPVVLLCHNVHQHDPLPLENFLPKLAFSQMDGFIVGTETDLQRLKEYIPNPIVRKQPHPTYDVFAKESHWNRGSAREALGLTDEPVILYFGAVRPYKGLKWLVQAAPEILKLVPRCQIWAVGDYWNGPEEFETMAGELGVLFDPQKPQQGGVRIVAGYVPNENVGMYFASSDLVVLPYETATQSGIVQIAYGFNKPCLVTDVGGLPEVVLDGKTGYVVPSKDAGAIAVKAVEFFTMDTESRAAMEREVAEWHKAFDWDNMVETIEDLHAELMRLRQAAQAATA